MAANLKKVSNTFFSVAVVFCMVAFPTPSISADEEVCDSLDKELSGDWVGEISKSISVMKDSQEITRTCIWDVTLYLSLNFQGAKGNACMFKAGGDLDIKPHDFNGASSHPDIEGGGFCSRSASVPLNSHTLSIVLPAEQRKNEEFKLEFSFPYTRGSEFDRTMFLLKHTEYEMVTLTPDNRMVLEAGELKKKSE